MKILALIFLLILSTLGCRDPQNDFSFPTKKSIEKNLAKEVTVYGSWAVVKLPIKTGVKIWNPIQLECSPDGLMYASNMTGQIYSLHDKDGDGLEDHAELYCDITQYGLRTPAGMVFKGNDLYVGTAREVRIFRDLDGDFKADTSYTFFENIPHSEHPYEYTSGLTFGPDDHLYLALTTDSWNAGASPDPQGWRGAILRISPDGKSKRFLTGIRSVPAMDFNDQGDLLFVDNAGGGNPTEELNLAVKGSFYGHNPDKYGNPPVTPPLFDLQTEVSPSGMAFNSESNEFDHSYGDLFISYYGPGEQWTRGAVSRLNIVYDLDSNYKIEEIPVASGIAKLSDLEFGINGDLYTTQIGKTDYWYQPLEKADGCIYRFINVPWIKPSPLDSMKSTPLVVSENTLERGKEIYVERICNACHGIDGKTAMLGPDMKDIGRIYSREELIEEIKRPSKHIKPSMHTTKITKTDGEVLLGRVVSSSQELVQIMVIGNRVVDVPRTLIQAEETIMESLMYTGLLEGLSDHDIDALLNYLMNL